jgi:type III pantothenate kinase
LLLTVDIGNTNVTIGVFDGDRLTTTLRMVTDARRVMDEYVLMLVQLLKLRNVDCQDIDAVCLCSVVPPLTGVFDQACRSCFEVTPLIVSAGVRTGLPILYDSPRDVGADRIVDAVAAIHLYGPPLVVVDLGTATVFDAVSRQGEYLGGAIAPGINLASEALFLNTSQLRRVELVAPKKAIGHNTVTAMQSGLVLGYADLVTGMVRRFKAELGPDTQVIGTGGLAPLIASETQVFDAVNPDLTLIGLRLIYEMNQARPSPAAPARGGKGG